MSKRKNPYEFRFENNGPARRIYACFNDAFDHLQEVEVSEEVYAELVSLNRSVRNIEVSEERHNEYRELTEEEQVKCGAGTVASAEDTALNVLFVEQLKLAFLKLPATQARRYLLAHVVGFSYAEIAEAEGCSVHAVKKSLVQAKKNLQEILRNRVPETPSKCGSK